MQELGVFLAKHMWLSYAGAFILLLIIVIEFLRNRRNNFALPVTQAIQMINHENAAVFDLRSIDQYRQGHIIDAQSLSDIKMLPKKMEKLKNKPLLLVCANGLDSQNKAIAFRKEGYNVFSLSGGMRAWNDAQMPLSKDKQ